MPSNLNTQTQAISGASTAQALPDGMTLDNTVIGSLDADAGTFTTLTATTANITTANITNLNTTTANAGIGGQLIYRTSAAVTKNASAAYADVTGLTGIPLVAGATYKFRAVLPSTVASGTGGIKYAFNYTTATLTSIEATGIGMTASAVAVQHSTTATTQADLFTQAAVVIMTVLEGSFVVNAGGTMAVQMAQNTSNASDTVALVGGTFTLNRIS